MAICSSNTPVYIKPSTEELAVRRLSDRNLELAIRALHTNGLVIVEDVYAHEDLDALNKIMVQDALKMAELGDDAPKNFHKGNLSITPPPQKQHFKEYVFLNSIVSQITSTHLGPRPKWTFNSANAALPSGEGKGIEPRSQPTHLDVYFDHPRHPFADVISVPLVEMTPHNGATEVYLGTHNIMSGPELMFGANRGSDEVGVAQKYLQERVDMGYGPIQPIVKKGSTVIRDIRLWHGGKPNMSDDIRIMLGQIHFAPWYRNPMRLELADTLKDVIQNETILDLPVEWIPEERAAKDYLQRGYGKKFDLTQTA